MSPATQTPTVAAAILSITVNPVQAVVQGGEPARRP
jgi:hypothetical protein